MKPASPQRRYEIWAGNLMIGVRLVTLVHQFFNRISLVPWQQGRYEGYVAIAVLYVVLLVHAFFVRQGKGWAKGLMLVFLAWGMLHDGYVMAQGGVLPSEPMSLVVGGLSRVITVIVMVLLVLSFRQAKPANSIHQ